MLWLLYVEVPNYNHVSEAVLMKSCNMVFAKFAFIKYKLSLTYCLNRGLSLVRMVSL